MPLSSSDTRRLLPALLCALLMAAGPQFLHQPPWLSALVCLAWILRLLMAWAILPLPGGKLRIFLTWMGFLVIIGGSFGSFAQDAGSRLLLIMAGLKPFEFHERRDAVALVFIAHLLVLSSLLFSESLAMALYMAAALILNHGVLALIHTQEIPIRTHLLKSAGLFLLAAGPALLLFVAFPRLSSPLWGIQRATPSGASGIPDRLQPGSLSGLAKDSTPAFRVHFDGPAPPPEKRYFRGLIFSRATPGVWLPDMENRPAIPPEPAPPVSHTYTLVLEPHQKHWAFALDWPADTGAGLHAVHGGLLRSPRRIKRRMAYTLTSTDSSQHLEPGGTGDLLLPPEDNPQAQALGKSILDAHPDPEARLLAIRRWFETASFRYTLNPGLLPEKNGMDTFLFDSRQGYCEHFAMGFALIARAAGLKSRVIGGYLGGEYNPVGAYLVVRQSDAHAWVEVFLPEKGWQRVDPTAFIAPARLGEGGMAAALSEEERQALGRNLEQGWIGKGIRPLFQLWDSATHLWHRQVLSYTRERQQNLLTSLRKSLKTLEAGLLLLFPPSLLLILFLIARRGFPLAFSRRQTDGLITGWILFSRKMARAGLPRLPHEGPLDYEKRIAAERPDLLEDLSPLIREYARLRYGLPEAGAEKKQAFVRKVRQMRISGKPAPPSPESPQGHRTFSGFLFKK